MKTTILLIVFYLTAISLIAQNKPQPYTAFNLKDKNSTIEFLVYETDLTHKKPVLLFLQGSLPIPLINLDDEGNYHYSILENFDVEKITKHFHLVAISSPFTPLVAKYDQITEQGFYVPDTSKPREFDVNYLKNDKMEVYTERIDKVIQFLEKQSWVNKDEIHVFGHSQGSRVAVVAAANNKKIKSVGLFGYNPFGRLEQYIRQARKDATSGKITWEQADSIINDNIDFMKILQIEDSINVKPHYTSWKSFSNSTINQLLSLKQPVYIANGTEDIVGDQCDMLPLLFIEHGKSNYIVKRYGRLEHNFFPKDETGTIDYKNGKWKLVIGEYLDWVVPFEKLRMTTSSRK